MACTTMMVNKFDMVFLKLLEDDPSLPSTKWLRISHGKFNYCFKEQVKV